MLQSVTKLLEHFWRFANYKKGEYKAFPPTSSTQSCSAVRATCCRRRTPKLWMEGRKEGCGLFCVLRSYLILGQCLNNFVVDCSLLLENFLYCFLVFSRSMTWWTNWNFVTTLLLGNTLLKSILVNSLDVSIVQITETCGTLVLWLATQQKIQRFTMPSDTTV